MLLCLVLEGRGAPVFTIQPSGNEGFDVLADGNLIAPIRLAAEGAIQAASVLTNTSGIQLSGLHTIPQLALPFPNA